MKAIVFNGPWDMTLEDLPRPIPESDQILLKVEAVGICGSDVHGFTGESGRRLPGMVMGHEVCGRIIERGDHASSLNVGDRVTVFNIMSCGTCNFCTQGREQLCAVKKIIGVVNTGKWGAMAEYLTYPADGLFRINEGIDPGIALLTEPLGVGIHAIGLMGPKQDDVIAIIGAGTIGVGLAIALKHQGIQHVFALDKVEEKLELIKGFGAYPININTEDPLQVIRDVSGKDAADGTFEAVGLAETVRSSFDLTAAGGTLVIIGNLAKEFTLPLQLVTGRETTIRGSYGFTKKDFGAAVEIVNQNNLVMSIQNRAS
jgi:L-iditol 2-dehydrogenase